ncbi:MAG: hypothetical protein IJW21_04090 [Clostridia bacterium]|nr:hypothetical protein [Clostridia bacterium]
MNDKDILHVRQYFDKIADICDTIDARGWWNKPDNVTLTLRDILQNDIENFIMYLSVSDGSVSASEIDAFKSITGSTGENFTEANKQNLAALDLSSEPPLIFKLLSRAEINAMARGARFESSVLGNVMALYRVIGHFVMSADGSVSSDETRNFDVIMQTIADYIEEHDTIAKNY